MRSANWFVALAQDLELGFEVAIEGFASLGASCHVFQGLGPWNGSEGLKREGDA